MGRTHTHTLRCLLLPLDHTHRLHVEREVPAAYTRHRQYTDIRDTCSSQQAARDEDSHIRETVTRPEMASVRASLERVLALKEGADAKGCYLVYVL